jgi:hypothetical protein
MTKDRTCLRPGCTETLSVISVCLNCANSDYDPKEDGVQFKNGSGQFEVTDPDRMMKTPRKQVVQLR